MNEDRPFLTIEEMSKLYREFGKKSDSNEINSWSGGEYVPLMDYDTRMPGVEIKDKSNMAFKDFTFKVGETSVTGDLIMKEVPIMTAPTLGEPYKVYYPPTQEGYTTTKLQESTTNITLDKHEVAIPIVDERYLNDLIIALIHQGLNLYYNQEDKVLCFTDEGGMVTKL